MMCSSFSTVQPRFRFGNLPIDVPLALAPMAGITDLPFRRLCKHLGAGILITEMIASRAVAQGSGRSRKMAEIGEDEHPIGIQIAGSDPDYMRRAARWAVDCGADFVDINMGCPVKKVCRQEAGSALLRDERKVARILAAVVGAVSVPVSLKIRTGWDEASKNVERVARIAEECGIRMLTVHGRTRAQMFRGHANWEDIAKAKAAVSIPVLGNGDVVDADSARRLLRLTGCDGIMVGRAVQGNPWVLSEVRAVMQGRRPPSPPDGAARWRLIRTHLQGLAQHYGEEVAARISQKHIMGYSKGMAGGAAFRRRIQSLRDWRAQLAEAEAFFCHRGSQTRIEYAV